MKTNGLPAILRPFNLALVATAIAALALISPASGQNKSASDDGIAASPKVRQALNEKKASAPTMTTETPAMTCPMCADVLTSQPKPQAKGAEILVGARSNVIKHTCAGCEVNWTVVGEGKTRHSVATHRCTANVPNNHACCASN
jgi:hypothetical protein